MYEPSEPPGGSGDRSGLDEAALAAGLRARDDAAVAAFLERYHALLQHCTAQFSNDRAQREDLYQELVGYLFERLDAGGFDAAKGNFGTWLYRVAWCRCVDVKRRESAGRRPPGGAGSDRVHEPSDDGPAPDQAAGEDEVGALVRTCLEDLDPEDADLLRMRHMDEMSLVDIAAARSQSLETVKYRVKRATQCLRQRLLARRVTPELVE